MPWATASQQASPQGPRSLHTLLCPRSVSSFPTPAAVLGRAGTAHPPSFRPRSLWLRRGRALGGGAYQTSGDGVLQNTPSPYLVATATAHSRAGRVLHFDLIRLSWKPDPGSLRLGTCPPACVTLPGDTGCARLHPLPQAPFQAVTVILQGGRGTLSLRPLRGRSFTCSPFNKCPFSRSRDFHSVQGRSPPSQCVIQGATLLSPDATSMAWGVTGDPTKV